MFMELNRKYDNLQQTSPNLRFVIFLLILFPVLLMPINYQIFTMVILICLRALYFYKSRS